MNPDEEIQRALSVLKAGGTLLYPTDTVWGIGCDATNEAAVQKVFDIKKRAESKSMLVLADDENKIARYVKDVPNTAWDLISYSTKPLTIIYPGAIGLAKNLIAPDGSVGIRITKDPFCKKLIHKFGKPIVSTSANLSGEPPPVNFREISPSVLKAVDYVVNLRQDEITENHPSAIIRLGLKGEIEIIRK